MAEIKINITNLDECVGRFKAFEKNWGANNITPPVTVGGGKVVNEFEKIAQVYKDMNAHMVTLAVNTAAFLTSVKESYQESDQKAADKISGM